jgi:hypothetical protein
MSIAGEIMKARRAALGAPLAEVSESASETVVETAAAEAPPAETAEPVAEPVAPAEPDAPAEPVAAAAAAPPVEPIPGPPPADAPPQASAVSPDDSWNHAVKLAGSEDPKALARKVVDFNRSASTLGRENKELKERLARLEATTKAAPAATPAPVPTATAVAAPPAPPAAPPATVARVDIETRAVELLNGDQEVAAQAAIYRRSTEAAALIATTVNGQPTGKLHTLLRKIAALTAQTPEGAQALGIRPAPDFEQPEILAELKAAQADERYLRMDLREFQREAREAYQLIAGRKEWYKQDLIRQSTAAEQVTEQVQAHQEEIDSFADQHLAAYEAVCLEMGLPDTPEFQATRAEIWNKGLDAMQTRPEEAAAAEADLRAYVKRYAEWQIKYEEAAERTRAAARAKVKRTDAKPQAPSGPAAVAPALPTATSDFRAALKAGVKARQAAASGR